MPRFYHDTVRQCTLAFSIGGAIVAPLLGLAVAQWGWRAAAAMAGVAILALATPVALFIRNSPESMGLGPDGDPPASGAGTSSDGAGGVQGASSNEFTLREAIRTPAFWLFVGATTLRVMVGGAFIVHFVAIMVWKGMGQTTAAGLLGLFAFLTIPFRLVMGWIGDKFSKAKLIALTLMVGAASFPLLIYGHGSWYLWIFIIVFAWADSNPSLSWALLGDYFGRRSFATIRGAMSFFFGLGQMTLPYLAGMMWDRTQSYSSVLWTFAALWLVSAFLFTLIRTPRKNGLPPVGGGYEQTMGAG